MGHSDWGGTNYRFKGDHQLYQSPHHLVAFHFGLLRNPLTVWGWFQISWTGNLIWVKLSAFAWLIISQGLNNTGEVLLLKQIPVETKGTARVHIPFTTSDLYNWKCQSKGLRENPEGLQNTIRRTYQTQDSMTPRTSSKYSQWGNKARQRGQKQGKSCHFHTRERVVSDTKPTRSIKSVEKEMEYRGWPIKKIQS